MFKLMNISVLLFIVLLLGVALAMSVAEVERGMALFNNPNLGGGTSGKSCNTCHPGGKGLEGVSLKKEWLTPGGNYKTLEDTVNTCISMALGGKPLDVKSEQMRDVIAYLKSLKAVVKSKKKSVEGCQKTTRSGKNFIAC